MALHPTPTVQQMHKPGTSIIELGGMPYQSPTRYNPGWTMKLYYFIHTDNGSSVGVSWKQEGAIQTLACSLTSEDSNIDPHTEEAFRRARQTGLIE